MHAGFHLQHYYHHHYSSDLAAEHESQKRAITRFFAVGIVRKRKRIKNAPTMDLICKVHMKVHQIVTLNWIHLTESMAAHDSSKTHFILKETNRIGNFVSY